MSANPHLIRLAKEEKARRLIAKQEAESRVAAALTLAAQETTWREPELDVSVPPDWFHEPQAEAYYSHATDIVVTAGHQSGKTECEAWWFLREFQRSAPFIAYMGFGTAIFCGPTLTLLADQAIPAFRRVFEARHGLGKFTGGNKPVFKFSPSGLKKLFGFVGFEVGVKFAYANDSSNLESVSACFGIWDEAGQKENKQSSYDAYNRRLTVARSTTFGQIKLWIDEDENRKKNFAWWVERYYNVEGPAATFGRRMFGTTPYEFNWFKREVYDRAESGAKGFELISFPTWANPRNSKDACMAMLGTMPGWKWTMFYEGKFTKPAGVIYDDYATVKHEPIRFEYQRASGHDFGKVNTAAVWAYRHPSNLSTLGRPQWVVYRSYLRGNRTPQEHIDSWIYGEHPSEDVADLPKRAPQKWNVARRQNRFAGWEPIIPWAWGGNLTTEHDARALYTLLGYAIMEPPIGGVLEGIEVVYLMLKTREVVFEESLKQLIDEADRYALEIDDSGEPDEEKIQDKKKFHRMDALRAMCVGLYKGAGDPESLLRKAAEQAELEEEEERMPRHSPAAAEYDELEPFERRRVAASEARASVSPGRATIPK